jgi:hypothetical protein
MLSIAVLPDYVSTQYPPSPSPGLCALTHGELNDVSSQWYLQLVPVVITGYDHFILTLFPNRIPTVASLPSCWLTSGLNWPAEWHSKSSPWVFAG